MKARPALLVAVFLPFSLAHAQSVLDVDRVHGPYTSIQSAVEAASPGDVVRVNAGDSFGEHIVVDSKSISIVASEGPRPRAAGIEIKNLGPDDTVVLAGLELTTSFDYAIPNLEVRSCAGAV
ncbi:MAG: hypothetical protein AAGG01_15630, partial [Planctomycetota bacterium]